MIRDDIKRFVDVRLRLSGYREATPTAPSSIELDVNQADLATMANLSRTSAGAILRKVEAARYVDLAYRRIIIRQPDKLRDAG